MSLRSKLTVTAGVVFALGAGTFLLLQSEFVQKYALGKVQTILLEQDIQFTTRRFEYGLSPLRIHLEDVELRAAHAKDLAPFLTVARLDAELGTAELLRGNIFLRSASAIQPKLNALTTKEGRSNLPSPPKSNKEPGNTKIAIGTVSVTGASAIYDDEQQALRLALPAWHLNATGQTGTEAANFTLGLNQPGAVNLQGRQQTLRALNVAGVYHPDKLQIDASRIETESASLETKGSLGLEKETTLDLQSALQVSLPEASRFAGLTEPLKGNLNANLRATGALSQLQAAADVTGSNLSFRQLKNANLSLNAKYDLAGERARVDSLTLETSAGRIEGHADVALTPKAGQSSAELNVSRVRLAQLAGPLKMPVTIASTGSAEVKAQWPALEFEKAEGNAQIQLNPAGKTARNVIPVAARLTAQARNGQALVRIGRLSALGVNADGRITVSGLTGKAQPVRGSIVANVDDLKLAVQQMDAFQGTTANPQAETAIGGRAVLTADLGGTVQAPVVSGALSGENLTAGQIHDASLMAQFDTTLQRFNLNEAVVHWQQSTIQAKGFAGLQGRDPAIGLTAHLDEVQVGPALAAVGQAMPVDGRLTADAAVTGTQKHPVATAVLTMRELMAYQQPLGDLMARAGWAEGLARLEELKLQKSGNETLTAQGEFRPETNELQLEVQSTPMTIDQMALPGETPTPIRGTLQMDAKVSGRTQELQGTVNVKAEELRVADSALGTVQSQVQLKGDHADATLDVPQYNVSAKLTTGTDEPYPMRFEVKLDGTDLAKLPVEVSVPLEGKVTASLTGSGPASNWEKGSANLRIEPLQVKVDGQAVATDGPLTAHYADARLTLDRTQIQAAGTNLALSGNLPIDKTGAPGELNADGTVDLATFSAALPTQPPPVRSTGTVALQAHLRGSMDAIEPDITLRAQDVTITPPGSQPVEALNAELTIREGLARLTQLSGRYATATLGGSADIPLQLIPGNLPIAGPKVAGPAKVNLSLQGLDLSKVQGIPEQAGGKISARLTAEATKFDLPSLRAQLQFDELNINAGKLRLAQQGQSTITVEQGVARVEPFRLQGDGAELALSGTAELEGKQALSLRADGNLDASLLTTFVNDLSARGATQLHVSLGGTVSKPDAQGFVELTNAEFGQRNPRVQADSVNLRLDLAGDQVRLSQLTGNLNGGKLDGGGSLRFSDGLKDVVLALNASNVFLDVPANLQTLSTANLTLTSAGDRFLLGGRVKILEGSFTDPINLDQGLFAFLEKKPELDLTEERNETLAKLDYSVGLKTQSPLVVNNNLAQVELEMDARLRGNYYSPGLTGRVTIAEGGQIFLNERQYAIDRGTITFVNEQRIEPVLDIVAKTQAAGYDITLQAQGGGKEMETTLTSDPPLPEPDIAAVLLTGRTLDQIRGQEVDVAKEQVLSYLTGRVGGSIGRSLERATGLSQVRIEPNLIANESDPSARLTIGQDITRQLSLIYSMNLTNSNDQIIVGQYDITKRFQTRILKQSDNSYRGDFSRTKEFGGMPRPEEIAAKREKKKLGSIDVSGSSAFTPEEVVKRMKLRAGKDYNFFKVRKGLDRLNRAYAQKGLLESRITSNREEKERFVDLDVHIEDGPFVNFVFEGYNPPAGTKKDVRHIWRTRVFDGQRLEDAADAIRLALLDDRYLEPKIESRILTPDPGRKQVVFDIQPGPHYKESKVEIRGAAKIEQKELLGVLKDQKLLDKAYTDPKPATDLLQAYYREHGFLDVKVERPEMELHPEQLSGTLVIPVTEGPRYRVGEIRFSGNKVYTPQELQKVMAFFPGEPYTPQGREDSLQNIETLYGQKGYNDPDIQYKLDRKSDAAVVDLDFTIKEGTQSVVAAVNVTGTDNTSQHMVEHQLELEPGDPLDLQKVSRSRKNLYNTGAYSLVDIDRSISARKDGSNLQLNQQPVTLNVDVQELRPFLLKYGAYFDTDRGPGGIFDISNRNSLGAARVIGLRGRYDSDLQEGRLYFSQPLLKDFPLRTTASLYVQDEFRNNLKTNRQGFSVQEEARFKRYYIASFGYRLEKTRTLNRTTDPVIDQRTRVAPFTASLSRETRDDLLDATRGSFISNAVEYAPSWAGSQLPYVKYFGQFFKYIALGDAKPVPFQRNVRKPRFVYAGGVRVGLAAGLGDQDLLPGRSTPGGVSLGERFFAGGGTTIRGFSQDGLGPRLSDGISPAGGDAVFIVNNELRFPLFSIFDGVGFMDIGNLYNSVSDFRPWDVRKTAGFGLRVRTPYFLIRFDYGFKLDRKPGEPFGRPFFSIGQAF